MSNNLPNNDTFKLAYVHLDDVKVDAIRDNFVQSLGGQTHVKYKNNILPLIVSTTRMNKCECVKNEYLRCCELSCRVFLCKRRFENLNANTITFISPLDDDDNSDYDIDSDSYSDSDSF